jgi:type I restriction enzyme M protein
MGQLSENPPAEIPFKRVDKRDILASRSVSLQAEQFLGGPVVEQDIEVARLADVAEINPKKSEVRPLPPETMVSFVPMEELNTDRPSFSAPRERPIGEVLIGYTYFRDGDVLLAKITPCFENGKAGIARNLRNGIGFGSSEYYVFRCGEKVVPEYLYYLIARPAFREEGAGKMSGTGGQQRVTREFLENYEIPLPPLEEQRRIVTEIKGYQQVIDGARQILAAYRPHFDTDPAWETATIGSVARVVSGHAFALDQQGKTDEEIPFYKVSDMNLPGNESCMISHNNAVSRAALAAMKAKTHPAGTIIFPKVGAAIATNKKRMLTREATFDNNVMGIVPSDRINPKFLLTWLAGFNLSNWASESHPPSMRQGTVEDQGIPLPPLPEQTRIVAELDAEAARMEAVRGLIPAFEAKIARTLARVWGQKDNG